MMASNYRSYDLNTEGSSFVRGKWFLTRARNIDQRSWAWNEKVGYHHWTDQYGYNNLPNGAGNEATFDKACLPMTGWRSGSTGDGTPILRRWETEPTRYQVISNGDTWAPTCDLNLWVDRYFNEPICSGDCSGLVQLRDNWYENDVGVACLLYTSHAADE